jgi:hypothetical protein
MYNPIQHDFYAAFAEVIDPAEPYKYYVPRIGSYCDFLGDSLIKYKSLRPQQAVIKNFHSLIQNALLEELHLAALHYNGADPEQIRFIERNQAECISQLASLRRYQRDIKLEGQKSAEALGEYLDLVLENAKAFLSHDFFLDTTNPFFMTGSDAAIKQPQLPRYLVVGVKYATGEIRLNVKNATATAKAIFGIDYGKYRTYISQSNNPYTDGRKQIVQDHYNIFASAEKLIAIYEYCSGHGLTVVPEFIAIYDRYTAAGLTE